MFLDNVVASPKSSCSLCHVSQTCSEAIFLRQLLQSYIMILFSNLLHFCIRMSAMQLFNKIMLNQWYILFGRIFWGMNLQVVTM